MVRYTGPRVRITRRLGTLLPGLTCKQSKNQKKTPGQHGKETSQKGKDFSAYKKQLEEKQKLRFNYGLTEKQLSKYVRQAKQSSQLTGTVLIQLLELRLDSIVFQLGLAPTIIAARQLITHGHITVNGKNINIPSYQCQLQNIIGVQQGKVSRQVIEFFQEKNSRVLKQTATHLSLNKESLMGVINSQPTHESLGFELNELLVVEYYSR